MTQIMNRLWEAASRLRTLSMAEGAAEGMAEGVANMPDALGAFVVFAASQPARPTARINTPRPYPVAWSALETPDAPQTPALPTRYSTPPMVAPQIARSARPQLDFTAQVMARISAPLPPPDPRIARLQQARAHARRVARIYGALIVASAVALLALGMVAPWVLVALLASLVSLALLAGGAIALVGRMTGGAVSGFGVAYLAMLAALAPPLLLLARHNGHNDHTGRLHRIGRGARNAARERTLSTPTAPPTPMREPRAPRDR